MTTLLTDSSDPSEFGGWGQEGVDGRAEYVPVSAGGNLTAATCIRENLILTPQGISESLLDTSIHALEHR